jgi:hypothetical protein
MNQNEATTADLRKQKCEMADMAIAMAVPSNGEPLKRLNFRRSGMQTFKTTFKELLLKGCDHKALLTALCMANTIWVRPLPTARRVKAAAKRMRELAEEITELEKTEFLILQHRQVVTESGLGPEDVDDLSLAFPQLALPKWLQKGAQMYEAWLKMATQKVPPRFELLRRVRRVCPVIYVKWATRQPFCERVARLLDLGGVIHIDAQQLSGETLAFEADYPFAAGCIRTNLALVHQREWTYQTIDGRRLTATGLLRQL